jgi:hypothetical protein
LNAVPAPQALVLQRDLGDQAGEAGTLDSLGRSHQHLGHQAQVIFEDLQHPDAERARQKLRALGLTGPGYA